MVSEILENKKIICFFKYLCTVRHISFMKLIESIGNKYLNKHKICIS